MTPIIHRTRGYVVRRVSSDAPEVVWRALPQYPTTATDRFLLMMTIVLLPLHSNLPEVGGVSTLFIIFGVLGFFLVLCRPGVLERTLRHPVFLAGYALVGLGLLMEIIHGSVDGAMITGFEQIRHYFLMFTGAAIIASLCRDRQALRSGVYGILLAGVWLSVFLILTLYTPLTGLSSVIASGYSEAHGVRGKVLSSGSDLQNNWNTVAFFAAQGAVVGLALGLTAKARLQQYMFLMISAFCTIATFLPMSRIGILILAVTATAIFYAYGIMRARVIGGAVIFVILALLMVPKAVFTRMIITTETKGAWAGSESGEYEDARVSTYLTVIEYFPQYILTGLGVSHFYGDWGMNSKYGLGGTHNVFAEVTIYWGLLGLLALLTLVWQAYQCLPQHSGAEPLCLCLRGIGVSIMVYSIFSHNLENKEFAIALGLLAGPDRWIWPRASISRNTTS